MYYYELLNFGSDAGKYMVRLDGREGQTLNLGVYATIEEAAAHVSYLNGGADPAFKAAMLAAVQNLVGAYTKTVAPDGLAGLFDPRALNPPRCVHGRLSTEPCEKCDDPNAAPPSWDDAT
jgi:hypothetical protein